MDIRSDCQCIYRLFLPTTCQWKLEKD